MPPRRTTQAAEKVATLCSRGGDLAPPRLSDALVSACAPLVVDVNASVREAGRRVLGCAACASTDGVREALAALHANLERWPSDDDGVSRVSGGVFAARGCCGVG